MIGDEVVVVEGNQTGGNLMSGWAIMINVRSQRANSNAGSSPNGHGTTAVQAAYCGLLYILESTRFCTGTSHVFFGDGRTPRRLLESYPFDRPLGCGHKSLALDCL